MESSTENNEPSLRRSESFGVLPPYMSLNLVLCGRTGAGKSSVARSILGGAELPAAHSPGQTVRLQGEVCGRQVSLVELPALSGKPHEAVMQQSLSCISLCAPEGVHAFILVLPMGPLTDEDKAELKTIQDTFGSAVNHFTMVLFTVDSDPTAPAMVQFVKGDRDVQELCQSCGGGHLIFNTRGQQHLSELMDSVETLRAKNTPHSYTTETLMQRQIEKMSALQKELQIQTSINRYGLKYSNTRRIVLLGKSGSGKSSLANTILGERVFEDDFCTSSVTNSCQKAADLVGGRNICLVDTPGLFNTTMAKEEVNQEVLKAISLTAPGPHVFLLVIKMERFTQLERETTKQIYKLFGEEALRFTTVVFTHGDELQRNNVPMEKFIRGSEGLKKLISDCGGRYHVVNNRETKDRRQVEELLEKIDELVVENRGEYYTQNMLQEAEANAQRGKREMERIRMERHVMESIMMEKEREVVRIMMEKDREMERIRIEKEREMEREMERIRIEKEEKMNSEMERIRMEKKGEMLWILMMEKMSRHSLLLHPRERRERERIRMEKEEKMKREMERIRMENEEEMKREMERIRMEKELDRIRMEKEEELKREMERIRMKKEEELKREMEERQRKYQQSMKELKEERKWREEWFEKRLFESRRQMEPERELWEEEEEWWQKQEEEEEVEKRREEQQK